MAIVHVYSFPVRVMSNEKSLIIGLESATLASMARVRTVSRGGELDARVCPSPVHAKCKYLIVWLGIHAEVVKLSVIRLPRTFFTQTCFVTLEPGAELPQFMLTSGTVHAASSYISMLETMLETMPLVCRVSDTKNP